MELKDDITKVSCGSLVDHNICFGCEEKWRSKMPLQGGVRIMKCPTCRQPEQYRTIESLQREARNPTISDLVETADRLVVSARGLQTPEGHFIVRSAAQVRAIASTTVPTRSLCESGRECRSRSLIGRTTTHLKCTVCQIKFCCRTCNVCVECRPIPSYMITYMEQLRL